MSARAGGSASLARQVKAHPRIKIALIGKAGSIGIWHVNGRLIRDWVFIDFTEGGNSHAYEWMPANEIWLDHDVDRREVKFVKLHELHEYNRMADGLSYERAHKSANRVELKARRNPSQFANLWQREVAIVKKHHP